MTIEKLVVSALVSFINSNFGEKLEAQKDKALTQLKALFERYALTLVPDGTIAKGKGSKATAHNIDEDKYIRVECKNVKCPTMIKPVYATQPTRFLCWVIVPDTNRITKLEELESFMLFYQASTIKKHDDFELASSALAARQAGEDIRNNAAQKTIRMEGKEENLQKFAAPFIALPENIWITVRPSLMDSDADAVSYIEEKRSELQS
jgi:hypothetical protein